MGGAARASGNASLVRAQFDQRSGLVGLRGPKFGKPQPRAKAIADKSAPLIYQHAAIHEADEHQQDTSGQAQGRRARPAARPPQALPPGQAQG
jgi:hypothetical protein